MGGRDTFWELEGRRGYSMGTESEHVMQPGNWRGALDAGNSLMQNIKIYNPA